MRRYHRARQKHDFWQREARVERYALDIYDGWEDADDWYDFGAQHEWDAWRAERDKLFDCHCCEHPVIYLYGPGRFHELSQNYWYRLPNDFPIATCVGCGERYLTTTEAEALEAFATQHKKPPA